MSKVLKCPICGYGNHFVIPFLDTNLDKSVKRRYLIEHTITLSQYSDASIGINKYDSYITAHVCKKCGHIELYAEKLLKEIASGKERLNEMIGIRKKELPSLKKEINALESKLKQIDENLSTIEKSLIDENITIKRHKELEEEYKHLQQDKYSAKSKIDSVKNKLTPIESEIAKLNSKLSKISEEKPSDC